MAEPSGGKAEVFPRPFGKFTLLREAGHGGKGIVYEALDTVLQRRVALKVSLMGPQATAEERKAEEARFLLEARIGAFLPKHPNIVGVYEAGEIEGQRYLSSEYVDGEPMAKWRKNPNVTVGQQVRVLRDVALAMEHAHAHGVVHRDLKPSNILVDREGRPHVTDFGLAKMVGQKEDTARSMRGKLWGTPAYMSPEHARGQEAGPRSDVYSMGVMLYEILVGHPPFRGPTSTDVLGKVVRDTVVAPSKVVKPGTLSPRLLELEPICLKALSKDPAQRHSSAKEFAEELTRWLDWGKTQRQEAPRVPRAALWAGAAALAFVGLVAAVVVATGRRKGPTAEEAAAARQEEEERERRRVEELEEAKRRAAEEAALREQARLEAERRAAEDRAREEEAKRRAAEEAALREQARLEAERRSAEEKAREAEERARRAEEQARQPLPGPGGTSAPGPAPSEPPRESPPAPVPAPAPGPGRPGHALRGPVPAAPPAGEPQLLETGALHWEAEDFTGGEKPVAGQDYHDTTPGNIGRAYRPDVDVDIVAPAEGAVVYVGYGAPGERLRYRLKGGGRYEVEVRCFGRRGGVVHFEVDGVNVTGPVRIPVTEDRQQPWVVAAALTGSIPEGDHDLRLVFDSPVQGIDWFRFKKVVVLPPPEPDKIREAVKAVREIFKADYARHGPAELLALARKLLQEGQKAEGDPVSRYVLLQEAQELAAQAGDVPTLYQAVDEMDRRFVIDASAMKLAGLNVLAKSVRTPEAAKAAADAFVAFAEAAAGKEDFDQAIALLAKAETLAKGAQNPGLFQRIQARGKEMAALRDEFKPLKAALKTLETRPDDPAANLALGTFRCFSRDDWEHGLPLLAKGSDPALAALARKELEGAGGAEQEAALGDAWREVGEKKSGALKTRCLSRALFWYEKAAEALTGLERLKVDSHIEALYRVLVGDASKKGLVFWVEPGRDAGEGYRELASLARASNLGAAPVVDGAVKALSTARGWVEYAAPEGVRTIEKEGTLLAWVRCDRPADMDGTLVSRGDPGLGIEDFSLGLYNGRVTVRFNHGDPKTRATRVYSKGVLAPGKWTLVGCSWEGNRMILIFDGKPDSEHVLSSPLSPPRRYGKVLLGKSTIGVGRATFQGLIGLVLIYSRQVSETDLKQIYVGSRGKFR